MRGLRLGFGVGVGGGPAPNFSPTALFSANEEGGWYDIDPAYMFQDNAGTSPVTATGQTVGLVLDRSGRGNHLSQPTLANRPIYGIEPFGGRRNLLTFTEQFDNAAWTKLVASDVINANVAVAPNGTITADNFVASTAASSHVVRQSWAATIGQSYTVSVYAKRNGYNWLLLSNNLTTPDRVWYDLQNGVLGSSSGSPANAAIENVGDGWYRCSFTALSPSTGSPQFQIQVVPSNGAGAFAGDGTSGILLWGAQLETGSTATAYQRVTDQWNVTQAGVQSVGYLQYDGTDDWFVSPTITPGIDKAQVFAGVRKLSDAARGMLVELGGSAVTSNFFNLSAPGSALANYSIGAGGSSFVGPAPTGNVHPAPITNILTFTDDIAADNGSLRVNGGAAQQLLAGDQGTGNFAANPLYVGRRSGTSLPFNGRIYSLIVRFGANLTADQIAQTEAYVNSKTGAY